MNNDILQVYSGEYRNIILIKGYAVSIAKNKEGTIKNKKEYNKYIRSKNMNIISKLFGELTISDDKNILVKEVLNGDIVDCEYLDNVLGYEDLKTLEASKVSIDLFETIEDNRKFLHGVLGYKGVESFNKIGFNI